MGTTAETEIFAGPRVSLFGGRHRLTTLGIVLVITVVAVEAMAVAAVMPTTVRELHGLREYGWAFTAFFLADVVGIVEAGNRCDRNGPRASLLGGLGLFGVGLVVAGLAPDMVVFVLGRAIQGLGAGAIIVAIYVVVARVYDVSLRPRAFAVLSAAWVLPALVGPAAAGAVTEAVGWRWVFLGIVPVTAVGLAMLVPVLRPLGRPEPGEPVARRGTSWSGVRLAVGLAMAQAAGQRVAWWSLPLLAAGVVLMAAPLVSLLPRGTLRLRPGLPVTIASRGILAGAFFGAEAYLPLTLSEVHHLGPTATGLPLTMGALGWAGASYAQGRRRPGQPVAPLVRLGFALVAVSVGLLALIASPNVSPWWSLALWAVGGAGMGAAMPTISVLTLALSPEPEQGVNSAALQICDVVGSIATIGAAGAGLAVAHAASIGTGPAVAVIDLVMAAVAVGGGLLAGRLRSAPG